MAFRFPPIGNLFQTARIVSPRRRRHRARLSVETLEDRIALSAIPAVSSTWAPIGPSPLVGVGDGGTVSGRVTSIATNPLDSTTIFIGTAGGGVW